MKDDKNTYIADLEAQLKVLSDAEKLQHSLFQIATISQEELTLDEIYQRVHEIISELLYAKNFFIALLDEEKGIVNFPYFIDEKDTLTTAELDNGVALGNGISSYVIKQREAKRLTPEDINELIKTGEINEVLGSSQFYCWIGAPIISSNFIHGIMVLQSYEPDIDYSDKDLKVLAYVASHVATAIEATINSQQRKQAQLKLAEQHRVLIQQNEELSHTVVMLQKTQEELVQKEKMASLGGLVAGIAHEINTPLGICVTGVSHLSEEYRLIKSALEKQTLTESHLKEFFGEVEESVNIISANMTRAATLVKSFKQVAVDQSSNEIRTVNVEQYIQEVLLSLRPKLKRTQHEVIVNCSQSININVNAGALSQVISNLIMNSLIHGFVKKEKGHIRIDVEEKNNFILLRYADNGIGVNKDDLQKLFEPFFTTKRGEGGSGLGTHLIYNIVTSILAGKISVQSELNKGIAYLIKFPKNAE